MLFIHTGLTPIPCTALSIDDFGNLVQVASETILAICAVMPSDALPVIVSHDVMMHASREIDAAE